LGDRQKTREMDYENLFRMWIEAGGKGVVREAWRNAYGDDYPEDADPASFVTKTDLRRIAESLGLEAGHDLVDLGCGPGGPGSHVARATGARLTGIDSSNAALEFARSRRLGTLAEGSRFEHGDFAATGLPTAFADGVMSTDALLFATDQAAVFREVSRITKQGGRLAFTSFELRSHSKSLDAGPIPDYRPFLERAGFAIEVYEEAPRWESRMRAVFANILDRREQLERELGEPAAPILLAWATLRPSELSESRRVFVVARRP
jgi:ubiquinone/menaquinone biosynthesis C-methylase UbiE